MPTVKSREPQRGVGVGWGGEVGEPCGFRPPPTGRTLTWGTLTGVIRGNGPLLTLGFLCFPAHLETKPALFEAVLCNAHLQFLLLVSVCAHCNTAPCLPRAYTVTHNHIELGRGFTPILFTPTRWNLKYHLAGWAVSLLLWTPP